jgi:hypothetical protein
MTETERADLLAEWEDATRVANAMIDRAIALEKSWDKTDPAVLEEVASLNERSADVLDAAVPTPEHEAARDVLVLADRDYAALTREHARALREAPSAFIRAFDPDRFADMRRGHEVRLASLATLLT